MPKKRKITDLYVRGRELEFDDGNPELDPEERKVKVWCSKLNPHEHGQALNRSQAARVRFLRASDDEDSEEFLVVYQGVRNYPSREGLINVICAADIMRTRDRILAEMEAEPEWADDGYLQALTDRWVGDEDNPGLKHTYAMDPEDPEAKRVYDEMTRFDDMANLELKAERQALVDQWADATEEELWTAGAKAMLEDAGKEVFYKEFQVQQVFFGARDPDDHTKRLFGSVEEVRTLDESVFQQMSATIALLSVEPTEGKGSPVTPSSSPSSEQLETAEESPDSGLVGSPQ